MNDVGGRYQRRAAEARKRFILFLVIVVALCSFSYWRGVESVRSAEVATKQTAVKLELERSSFEKELTDLRADVQSGGIRYKQLEEKYKQDVPTGPLKQLTDLMKKQLQSGIKPERLQLAIETMRPPKNCSNPVAKRFVIKTPVYSGPHGTVAFANGNITVSGEGQSAVGATGNKEAWYDPGKPVSIIFTQMGGKETVKTGLLPIQHSVVIADKEYRFTVAAGERSFITVTSDACDYP